MSQKFDSEKTRWDLMPWAELEEVAKVFQFGADKYTDFGWQEVPDAIKRYFSAGMRHQVSLHSNDFYDNESGLSHEAHAICCLLIQLWHRKNEEKGCSAK